MVKERLPGGQAPVQRGGPTPAYRPYPTETLSRFRTGLSHHQGAKNTRGIDPRAVGVASGYYPLLGDLQLTALYPKLTRRLATSTAEAESGA